MLQPGGGADLAQETLGAEHRGELRVQHLDRDRSVVLDDRGRDRPWPSRRGPARARSGSGRGGRRLGGAPRQSSGEPYHFHHPDVALLVAAGEVEPPAAHPEAGGTARDGIVKCAKSRVRPPVPGTRQMPTPWLFGSRWRSRHTTILRPVQPWLSRMLGAHERARALRAVHRLSGESPGPSLGSTQAFVRMERPSGDQAPCAALPRVVAVPRPRWQPGT